MIALYRGILQEAILDHRLTICNARARCWIDREHSMMWLVVQPVHDRWTVHSLAVLQQTPCHDTKENMDDSAVNKHQQTKERRGILSNWTLMTSSSTYPWEGHEAAPNGC